MPSVENKRPAAGRAGQKLGNRERKVCYASIRVDLRKVQKRAEGNQ